MSTKKEPKYALCDIIAAVVPIMSQYDEVDRAFIFGSYAKGTADNKSDVDIHIDADRLRTIDLCGLMVRLEKSLEVPVGVIPTDSMSSEFLNSIKDHEVLIYER